MSEIDDVRRALAGARSAVAGATDARVRAAAALRRAEGDLAQARRTRDDDEAVALADERVAVAGRGYDVAQRAYKQARAAMAAGLDMAAPLVDPRPLLGRLDAGVPILLLPVRLETRFKEFADPRSGEPRRQLWVRVFPDTCSVDSFGEDLTEAEVTDVRTYWTQVWRAAGDEDGERAAWRALVASHGSGRAAWAVAAHQPDNPAARPGSPADPPADPTFPDVPSAPAGWNRAPRAALLPDRFVLVTETGEVRAEHLGRPVPPEVFTGPDPLAPPEDQIRPVDGRLELPDELAWLVDFDRAVADGLGFRVDLGPAQAEAGFDRLYVVGVRVLADAEESAKDLATHLEHQRYSRGGLALVPQGSPTNNTEASAAAHSRVDDADASFDALRAGPVPLEADPRRRLDGQWLADLLGIDPAALDGVPHAHGTDQRDARAMQALLWPATLGYLTGTLLEPVLDDETVEHARWFFTRHVRGRGSLPALRVGRQPYGVLVTTAFSRSDWLRPRPQREISSRPAFLTALKRLLDLADEDWDALVATVPSLGRGGAPVTDAHATLLGVLGLHPTSAEFHYRYAESIDHLVNKAGLAGWAEALHEVLVKAGLDAPGVALLSRLGYDGERPPLLDLYFHGRQGALLGPLVDDRPLSESEPVRVWADGDRNYLQWLLDAAESSLDALRSATGFVDAVPNALLFLLARHALLLGYAESSRGLHHLAGHDADVVRAMRREPAFVHVGPAGPSESRYAPLYAHDPVISPALDWTVAAQVTDVLRVSPGTRVLREQVEALELLVDASTARLERALVEHLDTVSYRLDAWQLGLVDLQVELMRGIPQDDVPKGDDGAPGDVGGLPASRRGVHLGAYGWLEDVRPKARVLEPVELDADLAAVFDQGPPLQRDPANGGHLLAPSLNQAVTASVLRSAYLANATPAEPGAMAVNLSSERVRKALDLLAGMRQGQSLGELLGYALERGLHDRSGFAEVDEFIGDLRRAFPLRAGRLRSTLPAEGEAIEAVEARNVVDGLALVEHVERTGATAYPFALPSSVLRSSATAPQRAALEREIESLRDLRDAVGDLALAEAVHQAAQGSADRAGATLRSMESGHQPPEPEVVRTPAAGTTLTHRVGLHLDAAATAGAGATPRSIAEPAVDAFLAASLPAPGSVGCVVRWEDPVDGTPRSAPVTLAALGLRASDVVELLRAGDQAMTELDDRVVTHVVNTVAPRPDARLRIAYREAGSGQVPMFEVAALATHLRSLVVAARPMRASDVVLPGEASGELDAAAAVAPGRLLAVRAVLDQLATDVTAYLAAWEPLVEDVEANRPVLLAGTDTAVDDAVALLERGARLAVPGTGWGQALASRGAQYARTVARLRDRAASWGIRLADVDAALLSYDGLPGPTPDADRFAALARIEGMIAPALGDPAATPAQQRAAVGALRDDLATRRSALIGVADGPAAGLTDLRDDVLAQLPLRPVDPEPFELDTTETAMTTLVEDVVRSVRTLADQLAHRARAAQDAVAAHAGATDAPGRLEAMQALAEALLGEGFRVVPTFTVPAAAAAEWAHCLAGTATLLDHLVGTLGRDFPVEDWTHSAARVRPALRHLEQAGLIGRAHGLPEPELVPVQLPHRPGDAWLAMEYPDTQDLGGDHLLWTGVYPSAFDPAGTLCGLLLDEWTEVLPSDEATAGLAFHFDRPSSEAPQSMLLVTPASGARTWTWDDLRQAVPDTMRLARQRAVEPVHLDDGAAARFLPATVSAITTRGVSISLLYALNNEVQLALRGADE